MPYIHKIFIKIFENKGKKRIDTAKNKRENIDKQIEMLKTQLKRAKVAYEQGADTLQEYIDRKKELNTEIDTLTAQKEQDEAITEEEKTITIKKAVPKLEKVFASYPDFSPSEKNDLLRTDLDRAEIT